MEEQVVTGSSLHSNPVPSAPNLNTKEGVGEEIKKWMERTENDQEIKENPKSYDNAVSYIGTLLNRPFSILETTWIERQYVITLLKLWLENSLGKAFEYLEDEGKNISEEMSTLLGQLNSINSFDDVPSKLNDVRNWCDDRYLQLILDQTDLFRNTPCYTVFVNCYFNQFKTSCIDKLFSRCVGDIVKDERNGEKNGNFITKLNEFLVFVNEDKNWIEKFFKEKFHENYVEDNGRNLIEKLVEQFVTCSKDNFLTNIKKTEKLKLIFEKNVEENNINIENVTESDWQGIFHRLVSKISQSFIEANGNQVAESTIPDWFTHSEKVSSLLNDVEWTPKLQILTKEICKKFLLPETKIEFVEEDGKRIISIKGVVIFVSKMIEEMERLKEKNPQVEEIKIVGLKSIHIDCDLDNDTWYGTNIGIVTDKLIVDDVINEESSGFCWNVSGKNAIPDLPRGERRQPGESGGNVLIICNEIINGQNWTIVSDGGDGSSALKWTREEFEKSFPSMSTGDKGKAMETVLTTLKQILQKGERWRGENILPGHKGNFIIEGGSNDGNYITAIFYETHFSLFKKENQTFIHIKGGYVGQGGYGGDIAIECFATSEVNRTSVMPLTGKDSRTLTAVRFGLYEASSRKGRIGKMSGDVGFLQIGADGSPEFFGFEKNEKIEIELDVKENKLKKDDLYVKYENDEKNIRYAKLKRSNSEFHPRQIEAAVQKKSVIRQSLVLHLDEIDERNRLTKSIEKMLSNPMKHKSNTIDEIINEMGDKVHQLHQRTTQRQQHQKIEQEKYVRPAIDSSRPIPMPKITGRRPVLIDDQFNEKYEFDVNVFCLDELSTEDGIDNLLHCLFGEVNSEGKFVCNDTNKFRKRIAKHIREKYLSDRIVDDSDDESDSDSRNFHRYNTDDSDDDSGESFLDLPTTSKYGIYNGVVMFVLRVNDDQNFPVTIAKRKKLINSYIEDNQTLKGMETQLMRCLNHSDDYDDGQFLEPNEVEKWNKTWKNIRELKEIIKTELLEGKEIEWKKEEDLIEEYAKYIESPTGTLGLAELEILKIVYKLKVHVYKERGSLYYKYEKSLIASFPDFSRFILYGNKKWKRLSPNENLNYFCQFEFIQKSDEPIGNSNFENLKSWIDGNELITDEEKVLICIEKFNPQNKTPDGLSRILLERINELNMDTDQINELMGAICLLSEWVDYYNTSNFSTIFYLTIVEKYKPEEWISEFILLEMEQRLDKPLDRATENWRYQRKTLINRERNATLLTKIAMKMEKEIEILFSLDLKKLAQIVKMIEDAEESFLNDQSSLINLFYQEMSRFWGGRVEKWLTIDKKLQNEKKEEYVNILLELEYKNEHELLKSFAENSEEAIEYVQKTQSEENSTVESRNVNNIIAEIKKNHTEDNEILDKIEKTVNEWKLKKIELEECVESIVNELNKEKYKILLKEKSNRTEMAEKNENISEIFKKILKKAKKKSGEEFEICKRIEKFYENNPISEKSLEDFLCVFDYAIERIMGFDLRDTQRVAIVTLLNEKRRGTFAQVSTGEGKSIIVAGVAICLALHNKEKGRNAQIDVITSNDVLAIRDSNLSVADGGLKELYDFFNVTMANNCNKFIDDRKRAYNMDVVYGTLANFQRDHLLDKFYNYNIRGNRKFDYAIVDEVDCMLLDRGNNILYLSHDIPGMEMLESLYLFIWGNVKEEKESNPPQLDRIKSAILFDLYGQITEGHLNSIHAPLGQEEFKGERTAIWNHLIEKKVIDRQGRLLVNDVKEITEEKINYTSTNESLKGKQLNPKIVFYLQSIVQRERRIRIPGHLLPFVDRHLDTWLDNARRALELKQDEDYVIDHNRSDTSPDFNPQVIIIDPDTGTDQSSSQWDGGLHQFLQLKEGCKLTLQTLKAVFISNFTYIKKYRSSAGVSGTLGSQPEQEYLKTKYDCDLFTIPTACPKRFSLKPPKLFKTEQIWLNAITQETSRTINDDNRSIIVFCRSIKEVNKIYKHLSSAIPVLRDNKNKRIHRYTRDYEKFEFESKKLDEGHVIVATNLAGRGTDIKISPKLKSNGGLHICLTYFPENERVEDQAMGRAARKGEPGSGILILCESQEVEKIFVIKEERAWKERQRISRLEKDFDHIERIEKLFDRFTEDFRDIKDIETKKKKKKEKSDGNDLELLDVGVLPKLIQGNALDKWALWLDEEDFNLKCFNVTEYKFTIDFDFTYEFFTSSTPARRIEIAKHLATIKIKEKHKIDAKVKAADIFNELIDTSDKFFNLAAFYYRAFILLIEIKNRNTKVVEEQSELICLLRKTETILNEHIDMQMSFIQIHTSEREPNQTASFFAVDGYKEQKKNNMEILQNFITSIRSLLGTNYVSALDIQEVFHQFEDKKIQSLEMTEEKKRERELDTSNEADELFRTLIREKYLVCQVNDRKNVPDYDDVIRKLANKYNVEIKTETLASIFEKGLSSAKEIEKKLKKKKLILWSRKEFWTTLVNAGALIDDEDCIIMDDSDCEFDRKEEIKIPDEFCAQYNPNYFSQNDLETQKKIMLNKKYVKETLSTNYRRRKSKFESNKIAKIIYTKLKTVDLKAFGKLTKDHLRHEGFVPNERQIIWDELKKQKIIDDQGYHIPNAPEFQYPDCPVYEDAVRSLIKKTFPAEFVRRKWLEMESKDEESDDYFDCFKSIKSLPVKPYREMLGHLMAAHVISGPQVTKEMKYEELKQKVKEITNDKDKSKSILQLLGERQADYLTNEIKSDNVTLEFLQSEINAGKDMTDLSAELRVFSLVGFDHIIITKGREKTWKTNTKTIAIIASGGLQLAFGIAIDYVNPLEKYLKTSWLGEFAKTGLADIQFGWKAFKSPYDLNYSRHKIASLKDSGGLLWVVGLIWEAKNRKKKNRRTD